MFFVPEKSSSAVRKAERGCRSTRTFRIHEPRSHREEACRIRNDLGGVVGGELIVVFLHKCFPASLAKKEELKSGEGQGVEGELLDSVRAESPLHDALA